MTRAGRPLAMPAEERKKEIYAAAEKLFGERGYEKVTMLDIAAEAGMSKKTLYVHFADKEALLKALVGSSYIWPENAFAQPATDPVRGLEMKLKVIADHVLSERHLKLCRLAIGESIGIAGLADTFYLGIQTSRQSLIDAIEQIDAIQPVLELPSSTLADMLFGATIGKILMDALLTGRVPDMQQIYAGIDRIVAALFSGVACRKPQSRPVGP